MFQREKANVSGLLEVSGGEYATGIVWTANQIDMSMVKLPFFKTVELSAPIITLFEVLKGPPFEEMFGLRQGKTNHHVPLRHV
jgi:hypothetical protein